MSRLQNGDGDGLPRFALVPAELVVDPNLSPGSKATYLVIALHANKKTRIAWPAIETIAARTGRSRRSVINDIDDLVASGYIERAGRTTSTRYRLLSTEPTSATGCPSGSDDDADLVQDSASTSATSARTRATGCPQTSSEHQEEHPNDSEGGVREKDEGGEKSGGRITAEQLRSIFPRKGSRKKDIGELRRRMKAEGEAERIFDVFTRYASLVSKLSPDRLSYLPGITGFFEREWDLDERQWPQLSAPRGFVTVDAAKTRCASTPDPTSWRRWDRYLGPGGKVLVRIPFFNHEPAPPDFVPFDTRLTKDQAAAIFGTPGNAAGLLYYYHDVASGNGFYAPAGARIGDVSSLHREPLFDGARPRNPFADRYDP